MKASAALLITYSAGYLAAIMTIPAPVQEKPVESGFTVIHPGEGRKSRKQFMDRIEPMLTVSRHEREARRLFP